MTKRCPERVRNRFQPRTPFNGSCHEWPLYFFFLIAISTRSSTNLNWNPDDECSELEQSATDSWMVAGG